MAELEMAELCMDFKDLRDGRRRVADDELGRAECADKRDSDVNRYRRSPWTGMALWGMTFDVTTIGGA
jgi:hypothetical protein